jgi:hypothetical protein
MQYATVAAGGDVGLVWQHDADLDTGTLSLTITSGGTALTGYPTTDGVGQGPTAGRYVYVWSVGSSQAAGQYVATLSGEIAGEAAAETITVTVTSALAYEALAIVKDELQLTVTTHDDQLTRWLVAASRAVENACGGRTFGRDGVTSERMYYTAGRATRLPGSRSRDLLLVDDMPAVADLVVSYTSGGTALTVQAWPENALARGRPVEGLVLPAGARWSGEEVYVVNDWGWPSYPDGAVAATRLQTMRLFARRLSPEGVRGSADWGVAYVPRLDPDLAPLVAGLIRGGVA